MFLKQIHFRCVFPWLQALVVQVGGAKSKAEAKKLLEQRIASFRRFQYNDEGDRLLLLLK